MEIMPKAHVDDFPSGAFFEAGAFFRVGTSGITKGLRAVVATTTMIATCATAQAGEYFGLRLGEHTRAQTEEILREAGAVFDPAFGYKGYVDDLPVIEVERYERFDKFGTVREAWLSFSPDGKLYEIDVAWGRGARSTHKVLKDALDTKYGPAPDQGRMSSQEHGYSDGAVSIVLERSFFDDVSLTYVFTPADAEVEKTKELIEDDIRRRNAEEAASDL